MSAQTCISQRVDTQVDADDWAVVLPDPKRQTIAAAAETTAAAVASAATVAVDAGWLETLFPAKSAGKRAAWLSVLLDNEFETLPELAALDGDGWNSIPLPVAIKSALRQAVANPPTASAAAAAAPAAGAAATRPVEQLDVVVMDISGSMRAPSALDVDDTRAGCRKTREDVSKILFHTLVDKTLHFEVDHAVGLLAFGERVTPVLIDGEQLTQEYERFHDELGRLDANEGRTTLYDSIATAADMLESYHAELATRQPADAATVRKRVFVLTDGDDNASQKAPWEVARLLQDRCIVLDAIPLAGANATLHAMCAATRGGLCFQCVDQERAIALFEREATLRLGCREEAPAPPLLTNPADFAALRAEAVKAAPVVAIKSAVPKKVYAPALSAAAAQAKAKAVVSSASGGGGGGGAALRRVMKEYGDCCAAPLDNWKVFIACEDSLEWKAVFTAPKEWPAAPHFAGGTWLLSISFPADYPFSAPRVRYVTPLYHCNVSPDGMICLDLLQSSWSPAVSIRKALVAIQALVESPDAANPLDAFKGALFRDDRAAYAAAAREHTAQHAAEPLAALAVRYNLPMEAAAEGGAGGNGAAVGAVETTTIQTTTTTTTTTTTAQSSPDPS